MKTIVFILLLSIVVASCNGRKSGRSRRDTSNVADMLRQKVYSKIDECKEVHGTPDAETIPNCAEEVQDCFRSARTMSENCLAEEVQHWMKLEFMNDCRDENRDAMMAWFRAVCKTTLSVKKCMAGETAPESFKFAHNHHQHGARPHAHTKHFLADCWAGVGTKHAECKEKGLELCDNFNYCTGSESPEDDARLQEWHDIAHHNRHEMGYKVKAATDGIKACLERKKQEAENADTFFFF